MENTKTITLTNFEIRKRTSEKNLQEYFMIIDNDNNEAYFCFSNMIKKGWDNLTKSPSPLNIEIEYEESEQERNGEIKVYKRAINLYTDDDIIV